MIARTIKSGRAAFYGAELTTTAGRFLFVRWFVNGNGTRTMSPNSKLVVDGISGVVPDSSEGALGEFARRPCEKSVLLALAKEFDEILNLSNAGRRQFVDLCQEGSYRRSTLSHPSPSVSFSKYRAVVGQAIAQGARHRGRRRCSTEHAVLIGAGIAANVDSGRRFDRALTTPHQMRAGSPPSCALYLAAV